MPCSCIRGSYSWKFSVEVLDNENLRYTDYSDWNQTPPYVLPKEHKVFVLKPDGNEVEINVNPKGSTIITNEDLRSANCIQDGTYCFKAYTCLNCDTGEWGDIQMIKREMITPNMDCKLKQMIVTSPKEVWMKAYADDIEMKTNAAIGQFERAQELYSDLDDLTNNYNCTGCGCK